MASGRRGRGSPAPTAPAPVAFATQVEKYVVLQRLRQRCLVERGREHTAVLVEGHQPFGVDPNANGAAATDHSRTSTLTLEDRALEFLAEEDPELNLGTRRARQPSPRLKRRCQVGRRCHDSSRNG